MTTIQIHEFSTGIEVKPTPDGGWESGGFTGKYMNCTTEEIPSEILTAISSGEFSLSEGGIREHPAMVGRQVGGYSVVAVVSRGRDDRGRGLSLYRYFWCEGKDYIEAILRSNPPVFDPLKPPRLPEYYFEPDSNSPVNLNKFQDYLKQSPPIIISQPCEPLILNEITKKLQSEGNRAWAYNVAALEDPRYFQVIYPASSEAEDLFRQVLARRPPESGFISGEAGIKTAIKAIVKVRVKPEHIASLETALSHPQVNDKFWNKLLDGQGASKAYEDKIYSEQMVRLLTLKALLIPKFLPDFLIWMQISPKPDDCWESCQKLQALILKECKKSTTGLPYLTRNINDGIYRLLSRLIKKPKSSQSGNQIKRKLLGFVHSKFDIPQLFKATQSLLTENQGLWSQVYRKPFTEDFETVLGQMKDCREPGLPEYSSEEQREFFKSLERFWKSPRPTDKQYLILAQLFEEVGSPKFAAIFYQISIGEVPKNVFDSLSRKGNVKKGKLFEMLLIRQKGLSDRFNSALYAGIGFVKEQALFIIIGGMIILALLSVGIGLKIAFTGSLFGNGEKESEEPAAETPAPTALKSGEPIVTKRREESPPENNPISDQEIDKYKETNAAINTIVENLKKEISPLDLKILEDKLRNNKLSESTVNQISEYDAKKRPEYVVKSCIKYILKLPEEFSFSELEQKNDEWQKFKTQVREYQKTNNLQSDGVISDVSNGTRDSLEKDIRGEECLNLDGGENSQ